jgi:thiamine biosynthesis protein ThiI
MYSVVIRYQEVALKGQNRPWFVERLVRNIQEVTADLDIVRVRALMGRVELTIESADKWSQVHERVARIFGIANFSLARETRTRKIEDISEAIVRDLRTNSSWDGHDLRTVRSFRVRASRADKTFSYTSPELEREIGGRIKLAQGWKVDLTQPSLDIRIEVLPDRIFYSFGKYAGSGGLPSGTSGTVMCLLSGGIDSPVAAYRLMKRGCRVRFVHFHAYPILSHVSQEKVHELAGLLTKYQLSSRLYSVAFGEVQQRVVLSAPPPLRVVLYRRLMMRIAERLGRSSGAKALVTGESVGQVASQTLENLAVVDEVARLPVLRPLVGSDKQEITDEARKLGTYSISIIPDEDCCTLFTPKHPATKARRADLEHAEAGLPMMEMIETAVTNAERQDFAFPGEPLEPLADK